MAGGRSGGGDGEQLTVHAHGQSRVSAEVSQELVRRGEALVARPRSRDPVAGVGQRVVGEHESVRVEGVREGRGHAGGEGVLVEGVERVGGVHQREAGLEAGGRVVDAGVAVASSEVGHARVA